MKTQIAHAVVNLHKSSVT